RPRRARARIRHRPGQARLALGTVKWEAAGSAETDPWQGEDRALLRWDRATSGCKPGRRRAIRPPRVRADLLPRHRHSGLRARTQAALTGFIVSVSIRTSANPAARRSAAIRSAPSAES